MGITCLFFVISGIQYWATHYLMDILGISREQVFSYFMLTCVTSPTSGAIISGWAVNKCGGYQGKYIFPVCLAMGTIAACGAVPIPFLDDFHVVIGLFWVVLFAGAFILPIMTGIMFTLVEPELKAQATSLANTSYMGLGYLPAPTVYGLVNTLDDNEKSRYGMCLL